MANVYTHVNVNVHAMAWRCLKANLKRCLENRKKVEKDTCRNKNTYRGSVSLFYEYLLKIHLPQLSDKLRWV